jgi:elongation factor P--(R)-beta-lysine ligase
MIDRTQADFRPTASWANLRLRAELLRRVREFFHQRGLLEVETPILSADTVVDRHLDPFCVELATGRPMWLQTSPEFGMKRLLAAGGPAMYQISRVFRLDELGRLHNPEFTLIEWYCPDKVADSYADGMTLTSDLCEAVLGRGPADRMSYREAFLTHIGLDPHTAAAAELIEAVRRHGIQPPASLAADDRDGWLDLLLSERVQPRLGVERPALVYDYPASQAALARIRPENPPLAERFELYVSGIELANGYHELVDAAELRRRNAAVNGQRVADGKAALPAESRLLVAMESGLPPAVGVALGFDRLVMLAAGATSVAQVMAFPFDRA